MNTEVSCSWGIEVDISKQNMIIQLENWEDPKNNKNTH